jgi:single-strand DNA-binding protein
MNSVSVVGRTTKKPELQKTTTGKSFTKFIVAVQGYKKEDVDYILVEAWDKRAENIVNFVGKGHRLGISGAIKSNSFEKDNARVYITYVLADRVNFLESKNTNKEKTTNPDGVTEDDLPF